MSTSSITTAIITVSGKDKPGITSLVTGCISNNIKLVDIEQVLLGEQLILTLLVQAENIRDLNKTIRNMMLMCKKLSITLNHKLIEGSSLNIRENNSSTYALTVMGDNIDAQIIHKVSKIIAKHRANIEKIHKLSQANLSSLEIILSTDLALQKLIKLKKELIALSNNYKVDVSLQQEKLIRRNKRLVVMDLDSTLLPIEVIDELAKLMGAYTKASKITSQAMSGKIDFSSSLIERVKLLKGLKLNDALNCIKKTSLTHGADKLIKALKALGYKTAIISGGFDFAANMVKKKLSLDYAFANQLEVKDGIITGRVVGQIIDKQEKANIVTRLAHKEGVSLEQVIAIGDGANDILMLQISGLGVAFHSKQCVSKHADTSITYGGLDRILYLLGIKFKDIKELI